VTTHVAAAVSGDRERLSARPYDPDAAFWREARDHRVDLLLIDLARTSGADRAWPDAARQAARSVEVDASALRSLRDAELRRVLDALGAAGVPCLLLKGAALAHTLYRQPHTRPRSDADLLVKAGDAGRVAAILEARGYARAAETSGDYATSQMHFDRPGAPDHRYALDIHWRIVNAHAIADAVGFEEFAASRVPVPGLGAHAWALSRPHALALACMHCVAHHPNAEDLLWLSDLRLMVSGLTEDEQARFADVAARSAARAVCAHALSMAAARFPSPEADALIARVRPRPGAPEEPSARLVKGRLSLADILRADVAGLGWRRGAALIREHLFPPMAYMRTLYTAWPPVLLPAAYLHRIVRGAPKWLRRP
jgi:hypothetical protein